MEVQPVHRRDEDVRAEQPGTQCEEIGVGEAIHLVCGGHTDDVAC